MRADRKASAERPAADERQPGKSAPSGFALLAKRISSWTTNCVLSALILVAGLAFGRQVLDWWAADEVGSPVQPPQLAMTDGLGDPLRSHQIEFGDAPWAVARKTVIGTRDEAARALREGCRELTRSSDLPREAAGTSEKQFLASLGRRSPVAETPGQWQLYELEGGFPTVVGTRARSPGAGASPGDKVAGESRRVVTWGLAVPAAEQSWALYTFYPTSRSSGLPEDSQEIPFPPNSRKTISMRVGGGGAMVTFTGTPQGAAWRPFFDRWFRDHQWTAAGTWKRSGSTWYRRYARAPGRGSQTVDVQFGPDGRGRLAGLLLVTPADGTTRESEGS